MGDCLTKKKVKLKNYKFKNKLHKQSRELNSKTLEDITQKKT